MLDMILNNVQLSLTKKKLSTECVVRCWIIMLENIKLKELSREIVRGFYRFCW